MPQPVLLLALLPALAAPPPGPAPGEVLAYRPQVGERLTKTFVQHLELDLEKQTYVVLLDGVEQSAVPLPGEIHMRELELETFKDQVVAVEGARVTELRRTYAKLVRESFRAFTGAEGEPQEVRELASSDLERAVVGFRWEPASETYTASFAEGERAAELLQGLVPTTDLEGFLPEGEVAEGDAWDVDLTAFKLLSVPGGEVHIEGSEEHPSFARQFDGNLKGTIRARFTGVEAQLDRRLARIRLNGRLQTRIDHAEARPERGDAGGGEERYEMEFKLRGSLLWDIEAGRPRQLEFGGDATVEVVFAETAPSDRGVLSNETHQRFTGSLKYDVTFD